MPHKISDNAMQIYQKRYLDEEARTPEDLFRRVSGGKKEYFDLMNEGWFLPNSPTLFNAGKKQGGTLSACFVFDIDDCLLGDWPEGGENSPWPNSILGTTFKAACVAKAGGGVGYYLGDIREEGALVNSTHRYACGPVGVLRFLHGIRGLITQGGKRDLAQMAVLPVRHKDIRKFIHCKDEDPKALESFNISVDWDDKRLGEIQWDQLGAYVSDDRNEMTALWWEQCESAWRTGDPGMLFGDTINRFNATPHLGRINATNPCGETPNLNNEPCNLGSMAVSRFVKKMSVNGPWMFDWSVFGQVVRLCTKFLDDILDWNKFPHPDITKMALLTRKLGLGVMGYADLLALLRIPYDSADGVDFGRELMKVVAAESLKESIDLGEQKGLYPGYDPSKSPTRAPRCRNSTRTSIAPTGTIALLADCSSGIEPHFALAWSRTTNEGITLEEKIHVADRIGDFVPKIANEVPVEWHIKHQAAFQKFTDLGVSKTINLPNSAGVQDISKAYELMWKLGCKGGTVYRDRCRQEQVLVAKPEKKSVYTVGVNPTKPVDVTTTATSSKANDPLLYKVSEFTTVPVVEHGNKKKTLPKERTGFTHEFKIGPTKIFFTVNTDEEGSPCEIFVRASKGGSSMCGMLDAWAMATSLSWQSGTSVFHTISLHKGQRFDPAGRTNNPDIPICTSVVDYISQWLERKFVKSAKWEISTTVEIEDKGTKMSSGQLCPDCSSELISVSGCSVCVMPGCGYSKCG